jgi:hypothetical protein
MTVTVATAVTTLRERLDEATAAQWSDLQIRRWLNEGIRDIARRTRLYTDQSTASVIANTGEYTLAANILALEHCLWKATADTRKYPLEGRAFSGVQRYVNETGSDPIFYTTYGHPPVLKIQLWPTPTRAGTLYIYGPTLPVAMDVTSGTGNIDVIEGWLEVAYDYAEYMAQRKDKDSTMWKETYALYESKVVNMIEMASTDDAMGEFSFTGTSLVPTWLSDFD